MKNWTRKILTAFLTILTTIFGWIFYSRLILDYNSEGNYFDEKLSIIYHEHAVFIYGAFFFILFCLTLLAIWKLKASTRRV
jgi:hypothetical protein